MWWQGKLQDFQSLCGPPLWTTFIIRAQSQSWHWRSFSRSHIMDITYYGHGERAVQHTFYLFNTTPVTWQWYQNSHNTGSLRPSSYWGITLVLDQYYGYTITPEQEKVHPCTTAFGMMTLYTASAIMFSRAGTNTSNWNGSYHRTKSTLWGSGVV